VILALSLTNELLGSIFGTAMKDVSALAHLGTVLNVKVKR